MKVQMITKIDEDEVGCARFIVNTDVVYHDVDKVDYVASVVEAALDLREALGWAMSYGTFDTSTDNPLHKRAHLHALDVLSKTKKWAIVE
jgi:hypothetical protein